LKTIGYVLNVKDVINDAHNTFIKDGGRDSEQGTYMEDVMKKDKAFNWSDEDIEVNSQTDLKSPRSMNSNTPDKPPTHPKIIKKPKYKNQPAAAATTTTTNL
jgi:hypothetical protein